MAQLEKFRLSAVTWDSDADPEGFTKWMGTISNLVRSTAHGEALENFIDDKVGRNVFKPSTIPSFITSDADFDLVDADKKARDEVHAPMGDDGGHDDEDDYDDAKSHASRSSSRTFGGDFSLKRAKIPYRDMSTESKELDRLMYNVLSMNLKGCQSHLLKSVSFPSYVQAVILLYRHMDISRNDRKTKAFANMDKLVLKQDVGQWKIEVIKGIEELFESKCTIMDFALMCVMKSLNGKSKTIQHKIAEDINSQDIDNNVKIYDMIQGYASAMAAVGDGKGHQANVAGDPTPTEKPKCVTCGKKHFGKCRSGEKKQHVFKGNCNKCGEYVFFFFEVCVYLMESPSNRCCSALRVFAS